MNYCHPADVDGQTSAPQAALEHEAHGNAVKELEEVGQALATGATTLKDIQQKQDWPAEAVYNMGNETGWWMPPTARATALDLACLSVLHNWGKQCISDVLEWLQ